MLLSVTELADSLGTGDWQIVDVSQPSVYNQCHIPGARHIDYEQLVSVVGKAQGMLPPVDDLIALWRSIGLDPKKPIVVYDDVQGVAAARLLWTLHCFKGTDVYYLDGGIIAWMRAKAPCSETPTTYMPNEAIWTFSGDVLATSDYILTHLDNDDVVLWDARSEAEYAGLKVLAAQGGHIPGAINYEFKTAMDEENECRLRPIKDIAAELMALEITPDKTVITYCQSHRRSAYAYMIAKILGYPKVKGYSGSWSEWGNLKGVPVEESAT